MLPFSPLSCFPPTLLSYRVLRSFSNFTSRLHYPHHSAFSPQTVAIRFFFLIVRGMLPFLQDTGPSAIFSFITVLVPNIDVPPFYVISPKSWKPFLDLFPPIFPLFPSTVCPPNTFLVTKTSHWRPFRIAFCLRGSPFIRSP